MDNTGKPFFSIVIPVYNGEKYIAQCIRSFVEQTFGNFEIIAVNDGSTDGTARVLDDICKKDKRVRFVTVENGGVFRARAIGAKESKGTYLTYSDDDDVLCDNRALEKIYEKAKSEEYALIQYGYYKRFNHLEFKENSVKKNVTADCKEFYERDYPFLLSSRNIASRLMLNTVTKFYHRSLYSKAPDPEGLERMFMGDDMILNLFMLSDCPSALYLGDVYYRSYRLRGYSEKYRRDEMHNLDIIKKYQISFLDKWNGEKKKEVERLHHFETADWFFLHVRNSIDNIGEEATCKLIEEVLALPAFVRASEYFNKFYEDSLPVKLLLEADAAKYIKEAKAVGKGSLKDRTYNWLKKNIVMKI